ncbi:MAG: DUF488 domain-containing protein [Syntrophales bacterium]
MIKIKRVYDKPESSDGARILVDRLWPRGLSKETARIAYWAKDISPSPELRKWYRHDPEKWGEFRKRYHAELDGNPEGITKLRAYTEKEDVTFVYSSKEQKINNAVALKEYMETLDRQRRKKF